MSQRRVIERYYAELFNAGRIELIDELLHADHVHHSPASQDLLAESERAQREMRRIAHGEAGALPVVG